MKVSEFRKQIIEELDKLDGDADIYFVRPEQGEWSYRENFVITYDYFEDHYYVLEGY